MFIQIHREALAEALKGTTRNYLSQVSRQALINCVYFWARVLGKDGQQKYLAFLNLIKSVKTWIEPRKKTRIVKSMIDREDPDVLQRVVESYTLQESMRELVGKGKFDRMCHLADFHQHYKALLADVDQPSGEMRKVFEEHEIERDEDCSWHDVANEYIVCFLRQKSPGEYNESLKSLVEPRNIRKTERSKHHDIHDALRSVIELSSSFFALKAKFGSGIFVFLLERPLTM